MYNLKSIENIIKIFAIVVLYNKNVEDSVALNCLKSVEGVDVIICDNSTSDYKNCYFAKKFGFFYISMGTNKGLAKAYNKALDFLSGKSGYVCILDDDTEISNEYFEKLKKSMQESPKDIYLPFLYDGTGLLSPCKIKGIFVSRFKNMESVNKKNITGINSAMAINLKIFNEGYRYNEKYFLDYIDHDFLRVMKKKNKSIGFLKINLFQNFSGNDFSCKESSLKRFKIYKKDFKRFCSHNFFSRICSFFVIIKRLIKLTIKFKTLDFLIKS